MESHMIALAIGVVPCALDTALWDRVDVVRGANGMMTAALNLRNVENAKYLNSLAGGQAYYAAPRSIMGSLTFIY